MKTMDPTTKALYDELVKQTRSQSLALELTGAAWEHYQSLTTDAPVGAAPAPAAVRGAVDRARRERGREVGGHGSGAITRRNGAVKLYPGEVQGVSLDPETVLTEQPASRRPPTSEVDGWARRLMEVARERAQQSGYAARVRNLDWLAARLRGLSVAAIAARAGAKKATVKTGIRRARQGIVALHNELASPVAPSHDPNPPELEELAALYEDPGRRAEAVERLRGLRDPYRHNPWFLNIWGGWVLFDEQRYEEAIEVIKDGLAYALDPAVRAKLYNNWAECLKALGRADDTRLLYELAHEAAPKAPTPVLNLLAYGSLREDYPLCSQQIARLGHLRSTDALRPEELEYVHRRLRDNEDFRWVRQTDLWARGPARWLRTAPTDGEQREDERGGGRGVATAAGILLAVLLVGLLFLAGAADGAGPRVADRMVGGEGVAAATVAAPAIALRDRMTPLEDRMTRPVERVRV